MTARIDINGPLAGRRALVTGASRGIGQAIAYRLAMAGATVVVTGRTVEEGGNPLPGTIMATVKTIIDAGGSAHALACDLTQADERQKLIELTRALVGSVDILVNNGAVTFYFPIKEFPDKRMRLMFEVQVMAPMELAQAFLPDMIAAGAGNIIYISSGAALHPQKPYAVARGGTVYGMCKAAMERFSTGLAAEVFGDHVAVNSIAPGLVATPGAVHHNLITPANKALQSPVEAIAEAVCFLCRSPAQDVTGRVDQIKPFMKEFGLLPAPLIGRS